MTYIFIARHCDDLPVAVYCRVMKVSTSGFYAWQAHAVAERDLEEVIFDQPHLRHPPQEPPLLPGASRARRAPIGRTGVEL
jgi:hypothetical protein